MNTVSIFLLLLIVFLFIMSTKILFIAVDVQNATDTRNAENALNAADGMLEKHKCNSGKCELPENQC